MINARKMIFVVGVIVIMTLWTVSNVHATVVTIMNTSGGTVTLTDFISYPEYDAIGTGTIHLRNKDASDDRNLANQGKYKQDVGKDKSWIVSWNNNDGKEVETYTTNTSFMIKKDFLLTMFDSGFSGYYAVLYDYSFANRLLPNLGDIFALDGNGTLEGGDYDWISFYDVTHSDGFIERDSNGNILNQFVPSGVQITTSFSWTISTVPEPSSIVLLGIGLLGLVSKVQKKL